MHKHQHNMWFMKIIIKTYPIDTYDRESIQFYRLLGQMIHASACCAVGTCFDCRGKK